MGMQVFGKFIFVNRMHRGAYAESDCNLKTSVRAGSVFKACRTRRMAEGGNRYGYRNATSSPKSIGLLSYFSASLILFTASADMYSRTVYSVSRP